MREPKFEEIKKVISEEFDEEFYLANNEDVRLADINAIDHYIFEGHKENRDPSTWFSTKFYKEEYAEVGESGLNPLYHFLIFGKAKGYLPKSSQPEAENVSGDDISVDEYVYDIISQEFDKEYYLANYQDVKEFGIDPIKHYILEGWKEKRDPNDEFSSEFYLANNEDVKKAQINPFFHFMVEGRKEGRKGKSESSYVVRKLRALPSLEEKCKDWIIPDDKLPKKAKFNEFKKDLQKAINSSKGLVVAVGHDNYKEIAGGVQLCLNIEEQSFFDAGYAYLNIHPTQPSPILSYNNSSEANLLSLILNGKFAGYLSASETKQVLEETADKAKTNFLVVHSLLGHNTSTIKSLYNSIKFSKSYFWLHDYFSICSQPNLLRNEVSYCNAPQAKSNSCFVCQHGQNRMKHVEDMQGLFNEIPFEIISPSETALNLWQLKANLPYKKSHVLHHINFLKTAKKIKKPDNQKIRIAYVGTPAVYKGWHVFTKLFKEFKQDERYEFFHFGFQPEPIKGLNFVKVSVSKEGRDATVNALMENNIDVLLLYSVWPENFCIVAHEGVAAGAIVMASEKSGHVKEMVKSTGRGIVIDSEEKLIKLFSKNAIASAVQKRNQGKWEYLKLKYSRMTLDIILQQDEITDEILEEYEKLHIY